MRLPVALSILAHAALVLAAMRLPVKPAHTPNVVTFDIRHSAPRPATPAIEEPKPPPPKPVVQPAPRARVEPIKAAPSKQDEHKREHDQEPPPTTTPPQATPPPPPSSLSMRPSAPVDLTLHGLGGIVVNNGRVSGGEGGPAGTLAQAPRKPWKPRGDAGDPILGKLADETEERFPLKRESDGWHYDGPSFSAKIALDGTVNFDDHSIRDFKGLSGGFDVTDLAMKSRHQDPYRYEKEKFMDNTAKLRAELVRNARRARLESSLAALPSTLERVWGDGTRPPRERRGMLYAMWKEAAGSDDDVGAAGRKARATIEAFIRERLPAGSDDAFTDDELRRYNARAGALRFDPYKAN